MPATPLGVRLLQQPVLLLSAALFLAVLPVRPEMASLANLEVLLLSMTLLLVLSIGQGFAMITGGIDLSLPALMSLASVIGASIMTEGSPLAGTAAAAPAAVLVMLLVGVLVGGLQGAAVALLKMPALLVTLASLMMFGGLAIWVTHSQRIPVPQEFTQIWYGRWLGVPCPVVLVLALAVLAHVVLAHTVLGRRLYAVGHSLPTSVVSGVPVARTLVVAYAVSGLCAAIASVLYTARLYTGSPQLVQNEMLMDCIGAAVIGGTSLFGGRGSIAGIAMGALFLSLVGNSLNMLGLRHWHVIMVKGGVILLAALLDSLRARRLAAG
jgi:ribose/xylose/arabinose/galactoside ABC-type transport system permease subunit